MVSNENALRDALGASRLMATQSGHELFPYQLEAVALGRHRSCILAEEMGLGKTPSALGCVHDVENVLFVVPRGAVGTWLSEIGKWIGPRSLVLAEGVRKPKATRIEIDRRGTVLNDSLTHNVGGWVIMTHESIGAWSTLREAQHARQTQRGGALVAVRSSWSEVGGGLGVSLGDFEAVVVDESHRFGGNRSQRTQAILSLGLRAPRRILLSGTPELGGVHRLWVQLLLAAPEARWGSYFDFITRYCSAAKNRWGGLDLGTPSNQDELRQRMAPAVFWCTRRQAATYLPKETVQRVPVKLPVGGEREAMRASEAIVKYLKDRRGRSGSAFDPGEVQAALYTISEAKVPCTADLALEAIEAGNHIVLWVWHHLTAHALGRQLTARGVRHFMVTGETPDAMIQSTISEWARVPAALIAGMAKIGESISTLADVACYQAIVELPWLPEIEAQARGRLVRQNQTRPVHTWRLELQVPFERSLVELLEQRGGESRGVRPAPLADGNALAWLAEVMS